jgi:CBS domain-containing protein
MLLSRRISALPVVGDDGGIVGMITTTDCLLASLSRQPA